ncbi:hypothetical protein EB796_004736 [Bugula neritina]|uniref:Uncharacterized protein n=1 Tax=Bugula neritina TaxID=10212 RepID=A0A7J7KE68_BUGNE|nr:hypothetical protein EB796_004736 [Bugula neritina]
MFQKDVVKEWELKHKVSVKFSDDFEFICIEGTKHNVANCQRTFLKQLDGCANKLLRSVILLVLNTSEKITFFMGAIGMNNSCLVVPHFRSPMKLCDEAEQNLDESKDNCFSVKLPSGVTCEVKMEDITCLEHDAIVNPAMVI